MRILWLKTELLHPVDKGGRIRTYQMLRALARRHEVTYLSLDDGAAAPDARQRASEYSAKLVTIPFRPGSRSGPGLFLSLLFNLFSSLPYAVGRYRSNAMKAQVDRLAQDADLVVCDFLAPAVNVPDGLPVPAVLFQHNVEAMIWERHASIPQNFLRRIYMHSQWQRMQRFEATECRRFSHVVAVSALDAATIREQYGVDSVSDVATGVDLEYFQPTATAPRSSNNLVFVGSMDWMPNEDGVMWFAEQVFGRVRAVVNDAQLTIVGRHPSAAMAKLASRMPGIEITGSVPDVRPYLERAAISVVPLRVGGGTRLKIYEAMAMGAPIVSTAIGSEGLPVVNGEHLLIADTPEEQSAAILELLRNPARARSIAASARQFVHEHCSWDAVADQFLAQCLASRGAPLESIG